MCPMTSWPLLSTTVSANDTCAAVNINIINNNDNDTIQHKNDNNYNIISIIYDKTKIKMIPNNF